MFIRFRAERFHHLVQPLFGQIGHCEPERVRGLVRRNLPFVDPGSVRVTEEIVPRSVAGSIPDRSNPQAPYFNLVGGISPALRRGAEQQRAASRRMRSSDLINESLIEQDTKRIKAR